MSATRELERLLTTLGTALEGVLEEPVSGESDAGKTVISREAAAARAGAPN